MRGSEVQELLVDQGQRQNLEGHLIDFLILIVTEDSQISVQELFWSIEVKVEAKQTKDFLLKIDEVLLLALVAIEVLQGIDHVHEVRVLGLLDFGTYQQASKGQIRSLIAWEVLRPGQSNVPVENCSSCEECLVAVTSLFVKLEHELHGEGAVIDLEMLEASLSLAIGTT